MSARSGKQSSSNPSNRITSTAVQQRRRSVNWRARAGLEGDFFLMGWRDLIRPNARDFHSTSVKACLTLIAMAMAIADAVNIVIEGGFSQSRQRVGSALGVRRDVAQ